MTPKEAAVIVGITYESLSAYMTRREPRLASKLQYVNGHQVREITMSDFTAWLTLYRAKKPFGAKLHKHRRKT